MLRLAIQRPRLRIRVLHQLLHRQLPLLKRWSYNSIDLSTIRKRKLVAAQDYLYQNPDGLAVGRHGSRISGSILVVFGAFLLLHCLL